MEAAPETEKATWGQVHTLDFVPFAFVVAASLIYYDDWFSQGGREMRRALTALVLIALVATAVVAQTKGPKTVRRAQPPAAAKLRSDLFFNDAFKEGLVGERPADMGKAAAAPVGNAVSGVPSASSAPAVGSS